MLSRTLGLVAAVALAAAPAFAADQIKIGFMATLSGPPAVLGQHMLNGFQLGVEHLGGKIGGLTTEVVVEDDQLKPDLGVQIANKFVKRDRVDIVAGITFSNVMMAAYKPIVDADTFLVSANAGPSPLAGAQCSPFFFSTSWNNDQNHSAVGQYMQDKGFKKAVLMAPNYQAGRDAIAGVKRHYKGEVANEILVELNRTDFAAELAQVRAANPAAVYAFFPGGMGVQFAKQYAQAGLAKQIPLFTAFTIDWTTLGAIGESAVGTFHASQWSHDLDNAANRKFVDAYRQKHNAMPSMYAAQGYDAAMLIDAAVKGVKGKIEDKNAFRAELRKAAFASVRGDFKFNNNHHPIQDFYIREVVMGSDGKPTIVNRGAIFKAHRDAYHEQCPMTW